MVKVHFGKSLLKGKFPAFLPGRAAPQRSAERTAPSISAVSTPDIITPVGAEEVAIRTAAPASTVLRGKVARSDPEELSLTSLCPEQRRGFSSAHSRWSRVSRSACAAVAGGALNAALSGSLAVLCAILGALHASSVSVHPLRKPGPVHSRED